MPLASRLGFAASLAPLASALLRPQVRSEANAVPFRNRTNPDDLLRRFGSTSHSGELDDYDTWLDGHAADLDARCTECVVVEPEDEEQEMHALAEEKCSILVSGRGKALENGAIVYLVTRPMDLNRLKDSLPRLWYYLLRHWQYDVKVFVPGQSLRELDPESFGTSPSIQHVNDTLAQYSGLPVDYNIEVVPFDLEFPKVLADTNGEWKQRMNGCAQAVSEAGSVSYMHMNQFFTKVMYEHPSLDKYRYYLRIDADFAFMADLENDPFCMMAKTGRKFMWQTRKNIWVKECSHGLWEWFQQYQQTHGLTVQDPDIWNERLAQQVYVGYAGMGDLDFFRSEQVHKLAEALNEDGRIYLNRWSDQTYYPLLFALFENHTAVGDIGFNFTEGSWVHKGYIPPKVFDPETGTVR